jgi:hypothetical protein
MSDVIEIGPSEGGELVEHSGQSSARRPPGARADWAFGCRTRFTRLITDRDCRIDVLDAGVRVTPWPEPSVLGRLGQRMPTLQPFDGMVAVGPAILLPGRRVACVRVLQRIGDEDEEVGPDPITIHVILRVVDRNALIAALVARGVPLDASSHLHA